MASIRMLARDVMKMTTSAGTWSRRQMTTATTPTTASEAGSGSRRKWSTEMAPVYVLAGMITVAVGLGIHTAKQQLLYAPDVHVKKSKRETLPEVVEPEQVAEESDKFINKSILRKVGHVKELDLVVGPGAVRPDPLSRRARVETLQEVGVDPKQH